MKVTSLTFVTEKLCVECMSIIRGSIVRWRHAPSTAVYCCAERKAVNCVDHDVVCMASTGLETLCRWGRVLVVVDCSAVRRGHCGCQRLTLDLSCQLTSDEAAWHQWMTWTCDLPRLLHSPTHTQPLNSSQYTFICIIHLLLTNLYKQESPAVADKPARRLRKVCTVYVRAVGL